MTGVPPHVPPEHTSPVVQLFESLQTAVLFAWAQPVAGTHESFVHTLASSQLTAACAQPVAGTHESSVQTLASSQLRAVPGEQEPPEHTSPVVQAFPSLQEIVLFA